MRSVLQSLSIILLALAVSNKSFASNVVLSWNPSDSPGVAGYNVYFGTTSGSYLYKVNAGSVSSVTLSNLMVNVTYYFAVSSYDAQGRESALSAPLAYHIPYTLTMLPRASSSSPLSIQFSVAPLHWYEIQASTDLVNWNTVYERAGITSYTQLQFTDPNAGSFNSRFYRLVVH